MAIVLYQYNRQKIRCNHLRHVICLISCKKVWDPNNYVRETSQTLRSRMNNHRQKLNQMCDLFVPTFITNMTSIMCIKEAL